MSTNKVREFVPFLMSVSAMTDDGRGAKSVSACLPSRPGKCGGTWEPSSKKLFGLQENIQPKSRNFVENQVLFRESHTIRIMKESCNKNLS